MMQTPNLLSSSSRFGNDTMENIFSFVKKLETKHNEDSVKDTLAHLASEREKLKRRMTILTDEINSKSKKPKPLSEINTETKVVSTFSRKMELNEILDAQKLELYKLVLGVQISQGSSSNITFDFIPNDQGSISQDVYQIILSKKDSVITLKSATLPALKSLEPKTYDFELLKKSKKIIDKTDQKMVIPVEAIAKQHLPKVDHFITAFKKHLDAYLNRFHQLAILPEQYSEDEIHDIEYNDDLTKIQFQMTISEQNKEDTVIMKIALAYET